MIGKNHETGPENNDIEQSFRFLLLQIVEVHVLDLNVRVLSEQLLAGRNVVLIVIDPQHARLFEVMHDSGKGASSSSTDV